MAAKRKPVVMPQPTGPQVRMERMMKGLRINDVARVSGICIPTLSLIERGLAKLTPVRMAKIRKALDTATNKSGHIPKVMKAS